MKDFRLIRGERILEQLDEATATELTQRTLAKPTKERQFSKGAVRVVNMQMIPMQGQRDDGQLKVEVVVQSGNKEYHPIILFNNVIYEQEDQPTNVSFEAANNEEYHILPIQLSQSNALVRCDCLDFYFRFAYWNASKNSLYGGPIPPYQRKTQTHAPANPEKTPGMCKHLLKTADELRTAGLVK